MQADRSPIDEILPGQRLVRFEDIDSTNVEARRRYEAGERGPLWIWSLAQSQGKGRLAGRTWVSEPGNLYSTCLVTVPVTARRLSQASFVTALAVVDTVRDLGGGRLAVSLKWPNDVLVAAKKVSGILIESFGGSDAGGWTLAIGCGINLAHAPGDARYPATSLKGHGIEVPVEEALAAYAAALTRRLSQWTGAGGFDAIRRDWLALGPGEGQEVTVRAGSEAVSGHFAGLADSGALRLLLPNGGISEIHAGDVETRPAGEVTA